MTRLTPAREREIDELPWKLRHSTQTASNDDLSEPMSQKRARHSDRVQTMLDAANAVDEQKAEIEALRADLAKFTSKRAPVQGYAAGIPWAMHMRAYDAYCKEHGAQKAMIEGGCRGGFHVAELDDLIPGWREELSEMVGNNLESMVCQFCGEAGFDGVGLKSHLINGCCHPFNELEDSPGPLFVTMSERKQLVREEWEQLHPTEEERHE